jgi:hypothetical protein
MERWPLSSESDREARDAGADVEERRVRSLQVSGESFELREEARQDVREAFGDLSSSMQHVGIRIRPARRALGRRQEVVVERPEVLELGEQGRGLRSGDAFERVERARLAEEIAGGCTQPAGWIGFPVTFARSSAPRTASALDEALSCATRSRRASMLMGRSFQPAYARPRRTVNTPKEMHCFARRNSGTIGTWTPST